MEIKSKLLVFLALLNARLILWQRSPIKYLILCISTSLVMSYSIVLLYLLAKNPDEIEYILIFCSIAPLIFGIVSSFSLMLRTIGITFVPCFLLNPLKQYLVIILFILISEHPLHIMKTNHKLAQTTTDCLNNVNKHNLSQSITQDFSSNHQYLIAKLEREENDKNEKIDEDLQNLHSSCVDKLNKSAESCLRQEPICKSAKTDTHTLNISMPLLAILRMTSSFSESLVFNSTVCIPSTTYCQNIKKLHRACDFNMSLELTDFDEIINRLPSEIVFDQNIEISESNLRSAIQDVFINSLLYYFKLIGKIIDFLKEVKNNKDIVVLVITLILTINNIQKYSPNKKPHKKRGEISNYFVKKFKSIKETFKIIVSAIIIIVGPLMYVLSILHYTYVDNFLSTLSIGIPLVINTTQSYKMGMKLITKYTVYDINKLAFPIECKFELAEPSDLFLFEWFCWCVLLLGINELGPLIQKYKRKILKFMLKNNEDNFLGSLSFTVMFNAIRRIFNCPPKNNIQ